MNNNYKKVLLDPIKEDLVLVHFRGGNLVNRIKIMKRKIGSFDRVSYMSNKVRIF